MLRLQSGHMVLTRSLLDGYSGGLFQCNKRKKKRQRGVGYLTESHFVFPQVRGLPLVAYLPG